MPDTAGNLGPRRHDDALVMRARTLTHCRAPGTEPRTHAIAPAPEPGLGLLILPEHRGAHISGISHQERQHKFAPMRAFLAEWVRRRDIHSESQRDAGEKESAGRTESKTETDRKENRRERNRHIISVKRPGRNSLFVE